MSISKWLEQVSTEDYDQLPGATSKEVDVEIEADNVPTQKDGDWIEEIIPDISVESELGEEILADTEVAEQAAEIDGLVETTAALEAYAEYMRHAEANGGIRNEALDVMRIGLNVLHRRLPKEHINTSLEAFDEVSRPLATSISLESMSEKIKELWDRLKRVAVLLWQSAMDALHKWANSAGKSIEKANQLLDAIPKNTNRSGTAKVNMDALCWAGIDFVGDRVDAADPVLIYAERGYYNDLEAMLDAVEDVVEGYVRGVDDPLNAFLKVRIHPSFEGKHSGGVTGANGTKLDVYKRGTFPGTKALTLTWPEQPKDMSYGFMDVVTNARIYLTHDEDAKDGGTQPYVFKQADSNDLIKQLNEVIARLKRVQSLPASDRIEKIEKRLGRLMKMVADKGDQDDKTSRKVSAAQLLQGLALLQRNIAPNTTGIYSYLVKVYASQIHYCSAALKYISHSAE